VDHLASLVTSVGRGALLVKADIKEAYRIIPVHPHDQHLLGIRWNDSYYIDRMLPFGLRSAPKIFSAVADGLQWIMVQKGITHLLHYLDDFILVADSVDQAMSQKSTLISNFHRLGVPLELSKLEGPSTCLTFLGIEVDTEALLLRLPEDKLAKLSKNYPAVHSKNHHQKRVTEFDWPTSVHHKGHPPWKTIYKTIICNAVHRISPRSPYPVKRCS